MSSSTFADVIEKYIAEVVSTFRSKKETERCFRKYVIPALGKKVFIKLEQSDAGLLRRSMRVENGKRQADIVFGLIRTVAMWVEDEAVIKDYSSPLHYRPKRRGKNKQKGGRERILDDEELKMVWQAATKMGGLYGGLVRLALLTAQRKTCLVTAKWSEIVGDTWHVREEAGAKGTGQILRLPPLALEILKSLPRIKGSPFVFGVLDEGVQKFSTVSASAKWNLRSCCPVHFRNAGPSTISDVRLEPEWKISGSTCKRVRS
jgi:integrase